LARAAAPTDAARGSAATIETWLDLIRRVLDESHAILLIL